MRERCERAGRDGCPVINHWLGILANSFATRWRFRGVTIVCPVILSQDYGDLLRPACVYGIRDDHDDEREKMRETVRETLREREQERH